MTTISRALDRLIVLQPWFASLALRLKIEPATIATADVDGKVLRYNQPWFEALPQAQQEGVLAHETMHCALLHMTRREYRDPKLWNMAGDHVINLQLLGAKIELPEGCLAEARFEGMSTEQVYSKLQQEKTDASDYKCPCGGVSDATDGDEGQGEGIGDLEVEWATAVEQASMVGSKVGNLPEGAARQAKIAANNEDWRPVVHKYLTAKGDYSWSKPNRRFMHSGLYLPGPIVDRIGHIIFAIDTSGSISQAMLDVFAGEVNAIFEAAGKPTKTTIMYADYKVAKVEEDPDTIDFKPYGGGGTVFQPVFNYIEQEAWEPNVVVYLTDLEGPMPNDPGYPVLWVTPMWAKYPAPFGELVRVDV